MTQLRRRYRQLGNQDERSPLRVALSSRDGKGMAVTSRVKRELYARFCGRLEVKFLRPTRQRVLAVSNKASVSRGCYFASHGEVRSSYDEAWHEHGGVLVHAAASEEFLAGFFEMSPEASRRSPQSIPARKRAQYRRRYAMLDDLSRQIADLVDIQQRLGYPSFKSRLKLAA